jgi:CRISPR-associated protein Csx14
MSATDHPLPDITLDVDLRNPGQFFACCGLLELASRLWPGSEKNGWRDPEGWFDDRQFHLVTHVQSNEPLAKVALKWLTESQEVVRRLPTLIDYDDKVYPIVLKTMSPLTIDWWLEETGSTKSSVFKFWAAHQHPLQIFNELRQALHNVVSTFDDLNYQALLTLKVPMTTRFGLDPVAAWTPLDVGFAPNEHAHLKNTLTSPATELLGAIGLQCFRPRPDANERRRFLYCAWKEPLSVVAARAVAGGSITNGSKTFAFDITLRGRFKAFSLAQKAKEVGR